MADGRPMTLTELGAILIHVAEKSGIGLSREPRARAHTLEALANVMTDVYGPFHTLFDLGDQPKAAVIFDEHLRGALAFWDHRLKQARWLAGDYSIADMALYPVLLRLENALGRTYGDLANLQRWMQEMAARPGVQLGLSLAGRPQ